MNNKILVGPLKKFSPNILESYEILGTFFASSNIFIFEPNNFYQNLEKSIIEILEELPENTDIEYIIFWGMDNEIIPDKIENTKYKLIGVLFDITNSFESTINNVDRFDYIICDDNSKNILEHVGYKKAISMPLRAKSSIYENFTPYDFKDIDICFLGSYKNCSEIKSEILSKIADLSDRYNIYFCSQKYAEDYSNIIRRSKIVINFSDNNIAPLSCFEIMASGSLLFTDTNTLDIQNRFIDKIDCIYYNSENIVKLINYYLSNIDKSIEISNNAYEKVSKFTFDNIFSNIISKIESLEFDRKRNFSKKSYIDKKFSIALQSLQSNNESKYIKAESEIKDILEKDENNVEALNNLGVLYAQAYFNLSFSKDKQLIVKAKKLIEKSISLYPEYALARMNLAIIEYKDDNYDIAEKFLNDVIIVITNNPEKSIKYKGFYFTSDNLFDNDIFKLNWEKSLYQFYNSKDELNFALTDLILGKTFEILGDIYKKQYLYELSEEMYKASLQLIEQGFEMTKYNLAEVLFELKKYEEAIENLNSFLIREPFDIKSLEFLLKIYKVNNNTDMQELISKKIDKYKNLIHFSV
ncbi:MAG: hypothetical protein KatS3mg068_0595 [Candidatus Sericytochromatia bacterium]|nr:MAG: hypothetical protein KatS3mg068_0595 [Candidatus Sericytochromatia bacterium]